MHRLCRKSLKGGKKIRSVVQKDQGIEDFCEKEWTLSWQGAAEWQAGRVRTECTAKAQVTVKVMQFCEETKSILLKPRIQLMSEVARFEKSNF